ncbi:MAG: hypothetical protein HUU29_08780 [Planctomycetaceae bacterium]|nr:hypothetical protein [Planctomycetaceae bacterium]
MRGLPRRKANPVIIAAIWAVVLLAGVIVPWIFIGDVLSGKSSNPNSDTNASALTTSNHVSPPPLNPHNASMPVGSEKPYVDTTTTNEAFLEAKTHLKELLITQTTDLSNALLKSKQFWQARSGAYGQTIKAHEGDIETIRPELANAEKAVAEAQEHFEKANDALNTEIQGAANPLAPLLAAFDSYKAVEEVVKTATQEMLRARTAIAETNDALRKSEEVEWDIMNDLEEEEEKDDSKQNEALMLKLKNLQGEIAVIRIRVEQESLAFEEAQRAYESAFIERDNRLETLSRELAQADESAPEEINLKAALTAYQNAAIKASEWHKKVKDAQNDISATQALLNQATLIHSRHIRELSKAKAAHGKAKVKYRTRLYAAQSADSLHGNGDWGAVREAEAELNAAETVLKQKQAEHDAAQREKNSANSAFSGAKTALSSSEPKEKATNKVVSEAERKVEDVRKEMLRAIEQSNEGKEQILRPLRTAAEEAEKQLQASTEALQLLKTKREELDSSIRELRSLMKRANEHCSYADVDLKWLKSFATKPWDVSAVVLLKDTDRMLDKFDSQIVSRFPSGSDNGIAEDEAVVLIARDTRKILDDLYEECLAAMRR